MTPHQELGNVVGGGLLIFSLILSIILCLEQGVKSNYLAWINTRRLRKRLTMATLPQEPRQQSLIRRRL